MFNPIKATIQRLADLSWPTLRDLFSWSSNGSPVNAENPNLLVAKATNGNGDVVALVTAENILLVGSYVLNPQVTPDEAAIAGDSIDRALAQQAGVSRMWLVLPPEAPPIGGEKRIRVVERKVYQQTAPQRQASWEVKHSVAYLN